MVLIALDMAATEVMVVLRVTTGDRPRRSNNEAGRSWFCIKGDANGGIPKGRVAPLKQVPNPCKEGAAGAVPVGTEAASHNGMTCPKRSSPAPLFYICLECQCVGTAISFVH